MTFEIIGGIVEVEVIAVRRSIREMRRLESLFGRGRWRKLKGKALVRYRNGALHRVELHWYEAHGIGRRWMKVKRRLE